MTEQMEPTLPTRERQARRLHCIPQPSPQPPANMIPDQLLLVVSIEAPRMVRQRGHELGREMHSPRFTVLGLWEIDGLPADIDLADLDAQRLVQSHASVA